MDLLAAQSKWIFGCNVASMLLADKKTISRDGLAILFTDFFIFEKVHFKKMFNVYRFFFFFISDCMKSEHLRENIFKKGRWEGGGISLG